MMARRPLPLPVGLEDSTHLTRIASHARLSIWYAVVCARGIFRRRNRTDDGGVVCSRFHRRAWPVGDGHCLFSRNRIRVLDKCASSECKNGDRRVLTPALYG